MSLKVVLCNYIPVIFFAFFIFVNNSMNTRSAKITKGKEAREKKEKSFFNNHKVRDSEPLHHLTLVHDNEKSYFSCP